MRIQTSLIVSALLFAATTACVTTETKPRKFECVWISAKDAPVTEGGWEGPSQRAADGTSFFISHVKNAKAVKSASWHTSALGVYDLYINRHLVGKDFLKPGYTHFMKTRRAYAYDITAMIDRKAGSLNEYAAEVSAGWWRDKIVHFAGRKSAFRGVLTLVYEDGTRESFGTNTNDWKAAVAGPVTHAAIFDGEEYDARQIPWFARFSEPEVNNEFHGEVIRERGGEVTLRRDLAMKKGPYKLKKGQTLVVDFGQNCAAVPEFVFSAKRGTTLMFLPGEMLNDSDKGRRGCDGPKGSVYRANLRCPDYGMGVRYTFSGLGKETYHPRFTYFGYRYAEITADDDVSIDSITSIPVTSITKKMELGYIDTGDKSLNRFISNVYWGMLSNYLSIPTDCCQRNERLGWTADAQVFADASGYIADTRSFYRKWMRDMRDTQSPLGGFPSVAPYGQYGSSGREMMRAGWSDAAVIVPWKMWRQFGDTRIINENWAAMEKLVDHIAATKYDMSAIYEECGSYQWADWLSLEVLESCDGGGRPEYWAFVYDGDKRVPRPEAVVYWNYINACYWAIDARMMRDMAKATGRDEAKYELMFIEAKNYLRSKFFNGPYGTIMGKFSEMQTPVVLALHLGLLDGEARSRSIAGLRASLEEKGNLTGFLGTSLLMDTLCENGMSDLAVKLMLSHEYPNWLFSVDQGATTVWERPNSWTKARGFGPVAMNSFNHYANGAVLAWMYRYLAGIEPTVDKPGFKKIVMHPIFVKRLGHVKAEYRSAAGLIKSYWRYDDDKVVWLFSIPKGATAEVYLPGVSKPKVFAAGTHRIDYDPKKPKF